MEITKKLVTTIISSIKFVLPGLYLTISGGKTQINNNNFMKTAVETKAKIIKISTVTTNSGKDRRHDVSVSFSINGRNYGGHLNEYIIGMEEGEEVSIYYDPTNPNNFKGNYNAKWSGIGAIGGGIIFLYIGFNLLYTEYKSKRDVSWNLIKESYLF